MRKVFKIGFPILCVAVIGGTFILLNKTTDKINRLKLDDEDEEFYEEENTTDESLYQNEIVNNVVNNTVVKEISNKKISNEIHNN